MHKAIVNRSQRIIFTLVAVVLMCMTPAHAQNTSEIIQNIQINGIQRIEQATVLSYLTLQPGDSFDPYEVNESLKSLFATGLFSDVSFFRQGESLVVELVENPIINRVAFEGNETVEDSSLESEIQLRPRVVYTRSRVQDDVERITQIYRRLGRFSVTVDPKLIALDQNRVDIVFEISEGPKTKIQAINFIGNKRYQDDVLRGVIQSKEKRWYRFLTADDNYDEDRIAFDEDLLRRFYLSQGYADFKVDATVAELSPDREDFFVTYTITEGERYRFGNIDFENRLRGLDESVLRASLQTRSGEWYNADLVEDTTLELTDQAANLQYGFVEIEPRIQLDSTEKLVNLTYIIKESPRVFVERIEIKGNVRTLDEVIRREILLLEGDPYNRRKLRKSEQQIRDLAFFETVNVETLQGSRPDLAVIQVNVREQSTGELSVGAGFSTTDGPLTDLSIRERNLLGRGQDLLLSTTIAGDAQEFDLRFTEPYFLDRNLLAGIDLFHVTRDFQDESSYDQQLTGGRLRMGYPLGRDLRQEIRYGLKTNEITDIDPTASLFIQNQAGERSTSEIGHTISYDVRDSKIDPTEGHLISLSNDLAGLGFDARYLSTRVRAAKYFPVIQDQWVFHVLGEVGYVVGYGGEDVEIADRFFIGGNTLRGFDRAGIGPRDAATGDALGGNQFARTTLELSFPLGDVGRDSAIKGHLFSDAGTLYDIDDNGAGIQDDSSIRLSTGFGLSWKSPLGPLRADFAFPVLKENYDDDEIFSFSFGTRF